MSNVTVLVLSISGGIVGGRIGAWLVNKVVAVICSTRPTTHATTSLWTAVKITLVLYVRGTERAVRYSDRLAAKGR